MLCLPSSLEGLLVLLAPCFTRPTFLTFRAMVAGQISQTGLRTVTGMLIGARLSGIWHHARAHRFFSDARWSADELGLRLLDVIVARLTEPGSPLTLPVDDTLLHRLGRKVHATFWHHDATANTDRAAVAWGNNWVVVGINVKLPFLERTACLPILSRARSWPGCLRRLRAWRRAQRASAALSKARRPSSLPRSTRATASRVNTSRLCSTAWRSSLAMAARRIRRGSPVSCYS
jgi:DDE superfamily endonuclease